MPAWGHEEVDRINISFMNWERKIGLFLEREVEGKDDFTFH